MLNIMLIIDKNIVVGQKTKLDFNIQILLSGNQEGKIGSTILLD